MSTVARTYTFTDGTDAYGSQVETEIGTLSDAHNNHDAGTSSWTLMKAVKATITSDPVSTPDSNTIYKANIVKGWCVFNGTGTPAVIDSFNVSSITDHGIGDYSVVWDTDFANINHADIVACNYANVAGPSADTPLVGTSRIRTFDPATTTASDVTPIKVIAIGDQ